MLPIAMLVGVVAHNFIGYFDFLSKYLIFVMLLITYTRIKPTELKPTRSMLGLLAIQIVGSVALYVAIKPFDETVAQAAFICVFCPTATAAPVITRMLGGSIEWVATYSLLSNMSVALLGPLLLAYIGSGDQPLAASITFGESFVRIAVNVVPLIIGPLVVAFLLKLTFPKGHAALASHQSLSFYIWAISLIIVVGNAVSFILKEPSAMIPKMIVIALVSLALCLIQFAVGRSVGSRNGNPVSCAQSLGQKNTVLAIWLALTYLNPLASIGPACYIAWHNSVNSYQIYRVGRTRDK